MSRNSQFRPFKEIQLPEAERQRMIKQFKEEGFTDEQIGNLSMRLRSLEKQNGLNEIIFEVSDRIIKDDSWDIDLHINSHIGTLKDGEAKRKVQQIWGKELMEKNAFQYLKDQLKDSGWILKNGEMINGKEYDCLGWYLEIKDIQHPDLAIEMTFPMPKQGEKYSLPFLEERARYMREKLKLLDAWYRCILIGIPPNKTANFLEIGHADMRLKFQRHKFGKINLMKKPKKT